MSIDQLKRLDLGYLADLLRNNDSKERADEILQEYSKKHMVSSDDLEKILSSNWDCIKCSHTGKFFKFENLPNKEEKEKYCINCGEDENFTYIRTTASSFVDKGTNHYTCNNCGEELSFIEDL